VESRETFPRVHRLENMSISSVLSPLLMRYSRRFETERHSPDAIAEQFPRTCNPKRGPRKSRNGSKTGCRRLVLPKITASSKLEIQTGQSWRNLLSPKCTRDGRPSSAISNHWFCLACASTGAGSFTSPEWKAEESEPHIGIFCEPAHSRAAI